MKKGFFVFCCLFFSLFIAATKAAPDIQPEIVDFLKPKLNSDRIEYFFGSYGIDTLDIDSPVFPNSRITNLYSIHNEKKIMRTLAIVDFTQPIHPDLSDAHREIAEGKSIGIALRKHGWVIHKTPVYFGTIPLSAGLMDWMKESRVDQAALHIYLLEVSKDGKPYYIPYCTIMEVHSPQYLTIEWLQALYDDQYEKFSIATEEVTSLLYRLSILIHDLYL